MQIIDISGPVYTGMWNYTEPLGSMLGNFSLTAIDFEFGGEKYSVDTFEGFKAQTGTYIEAPGKYQDKNYFLSDIPVEKLFMIDAYLLFIEFEKLGEKDGKRYISLEDITAAEKSPVPEGSAILVGTGYGKNWGKKDFFSKSWFFKKEAMEYIISRKPFLFTYLDEPLGGAGITGKALPWQPLMQQVLRPLLLP